MDSAHIQHAIAQVTQFFREHPDRGPVTDKAAVATVQSGLVCKAEGPRGEELVSDMPRSVGGQASAPTPGWFLRAALANCDATVIAMRAAQLGVPLSRLQVTVESRSDDRGMLGVVPDIPAGPQALQVHVEITSAYASAEQLREIVHWAEQHSPVGDALRRAIPTALTIAVG